MHARTGSRSTFGFPQNDLLWENKKIDSRPPNHTTVLHALRFSYPVCPELPQPYRRLTLYLPYTHELPCTISPASLARVLHRRPQQPSPTVLPCTYPTPPAQPSYPILPALLHAWLPYTRSRNYPTPTLYHSPNAVSLDGPSGQVRPTYPTPALPAMWWPTLHHSLARSQDGPSQRPSPTSLPYTQPVAGRFPPGGGPAIPHGQVQTGYPTPVRDTPYAAPSRGAYIGEI